MSDAVMVPTLRDAAQAVVDRWETPLWKDVEPTAHVIARLRQALAASTPVGGWEDISTAPEQGEVLVGVWVDGRWSSWTINKEPNTATPFGCDGEYGDEPTHWMPLPEAPKGGEA